MGVGTFHGLGEMPNIKYAYQYRKEFPNGPYMGKVALILANFHKDLYMVVRDLHKSKGKNKDYKYDCYRKYIERKPLEVQIEDNKRIAIKFYQRIRWYN